MPHFPISVWLPAIFNFILPFCSWKTKENSLKDDILFSFHKFVEFHFCLLIKQHSWTGLIDN